METDEKRQPSWSQEHEPELEKWNGTRTNAFRYVATLYSFIVMGMNDGAVGVRFPRKRSSETIADDTTGLAAICGLNIPSRYR